MFDRLKKIPHLLECVLQKFGFGFKLFLKHLVQRLEPEDQTSLFIDRETCMFVVKLTCFSNNSMVDALDCSQTVDKLEFFS